MTPSGQSVVAAEVGFWAVYARVVRHLVFALEIVAGIGILTMVAVTCAEVILRIFRVSMKGTVDIVSVCAAVTAAAAMPYTTACKGHVPSSISSTSSPVSADHRGQLLPHLRPAVVRVPRRGVCHLRDGSESQGPGYPTLQMPEFWVPYVLAVSCAVVCLVKIYHLFHPGKELIKP